MGDTDINEKTRENEEKSKGKTSVGIVEKGRGKGGRVNKVSVSNLILLILLIVVLISTLFASVTTGDFTPNLFGYRTILVVSGSMEPVIHTNSLCVIKYCNIEDIELGDIVLYRNDKLGMDIVHRAIEKGIDNNKLTLRTKGDANNSQDAMKIIEDSLYGKVVYIANWTSPILNFIYHDEGQLYQGRFIILLFVIACTLTVISIIASFIKEMLLAIYFSHSGFNETHKKRLKYLLELNDNYIISSTDDIGVKIKKVKLTWTLLNMEDGMAYIGNTSK